MSYLNTMTQLLSEAKSSIHERHIYQWENMCRQMINELVPMIVKETLIETYFDLWVKIKMTIEGKEVSFSQVSDYIMKEIENALKSGISK